MAVLMWCLSLVLTALVARALGGRRSGETQRPLRMAARPPQPAFVAPTALRPSPRVAVGTSAALLAIALALDVSNAPQFQATPAEASGLYSAAADEIHLLPEATPLPWTPVELAPDWAYKAVGATDGWLL